MKARYGIVGVLATFLILTVGIGVSDAGIRVPLEKVPPPAVKGLRDRFVKPEIRWVDREGNGSYEFTLREGDRQFEVGISADGKLLNVKEEITEAKLPAPVKEAVEKKFPGAKFVECEKVINGEGDSAKVVFELVISTDKSRKTAVELDPTGKFLD